jgi:hypothetical protein
VIPALALTATLLAASRSGCYLVSNKEIEVIPCNFDPKVIADRLAKMDAQASADASRSGAPQANDKQARVQARASPETDVRAQPRHGSIQSAPNPPVPGATQAQGGVAGAPAPGSDAAHAAGAPTTPKPEAPPPAAAQATVPGQGAAPQATSPTSQELEAQRAAARRAADAAVADLRALEPALASGSASDAQGVLARAAQAFAAADSSRGAAAVAKAQEALARGDLFAARQAIAAATREAARR